MLVKYPPLASETLVLSEDNLKRTELKSCYFLLLRDDSAPKLSFGSVWRHFGS